MFLLESAESQIFQVKQSTTLLEAAFLRALIAPSKTWPFPFCLIREEERSQVSWVLGLPTRSFTLLNLDL